MGDIADLSDKVMVMNDGKLMMVGTPEEVFDHPKSEKTRSFIRGAQQAF